MHVFPYLTYLVIEMALKSTSSLKKDEVNDSISYTLSLSAFTGCSDTNWWTPLEWGVMVYYTYVTGYLFALENSFPFDGWSSVEEEESLFGYALLSMKSNCLICCNGASGCCQSFRPSGEMKWSSAEALRKMSPMILLINFFPFIFIWSSCCIW